MHIARILLGVGDADHVSVPASVLDYDPVRHDLRDLWHEDPDISERLDEEETDLGSVKKQ
jgi:hypothetical protein